MLAPVETTHSLPHSEESERAVLAAILLDAERHLAATSSRLKPEDYYFERHRLLYEAMLALQEAESPIDLRTLQARLEQRGEFESAGGVALSGHARGSTCPTWAGWTPTSRSSRNELYGGV